VTTNPSGAQVYLDGALVGVTPVTVRDVAAGTHRVKLTREGYADRESQVQVPAGGATDMRIDLVKAAGDQAVDGSAGEAGGSPHRDKRSGHLAALVLAAGAAATGIIVAAGNDDPGNVAPTGGEIIGEPPVGLVGIASTLAVSAVVDLGPLTYSWTLGDGGTASGQRVTHTYNAPGFYTIGVTVSDGEFSTTITGNHLVTALTGSWAGSINGFETRVELRQEGLALGGTLTLVGAGAGSRAPLTGRVEAPAGLAYPVEFSAQPACCGPISFAGSLDITQGLNRLAGTAQGQGVNGRPWILTR
jgi:hypothetical protein